MGVWVGGGGGWGGGGRGMTEVVGEVGGRVWGVDRLEFLYTCAYVCVCGCVCLHWVVFCFGL